jgi:hypothetical protein
MKKFTKENKMEELTLKDLKTKDQTLELWHPISGKWTHLVQVDKNNIRKFYTNGVFELELKVDENGNALIPQTTQLKENPSEETTNDKS